MTCPQCNDDTECWWSYCALCGWHIASGNKPAATFPWGEPRYRKASTAVNTIADELIQQMRAGEYQAPSRLLLHPVDDVQFDHDRDRDEQGLAVGKKP